MELQTLSPGTDLIRDLVTWSNKAVFKTHRPEHQPIKTKNKFMRGQGT